MSYLDITQYYYSLWLGVRPEVMDSAGAHLVCSPLRDVRQKGYSRPVSLFCWFAGSTTIVSYSKSLTGALAPLVGLATEAGGSASWRSLLSDTFPTVEAGRKYVFGRLPDAIQRADAMPLSKEDYPAYRRFFLEQHPNVQEVDWLPQYFSSIVEKGLAYGIVKGDELVSATDAPEMPFLEDQVQEIGVNTLASHRGQGYGKQVVAATIQYLLGKGIVPMWSCAAWNDASDALARAVGFRRLAETCSLVG